MKQTHGIIATVLCLLLASAQLSAQALLAPKVPDSVKTDISKNLKASRADLVVESISSSPINGLYEVKIANGPVIYSTADGSYFVLGDLFKAGTGGFINLAEKRRESDRANAMAGIKVEDMIVFSPKDQPVKASVAVFTDVDCFYCQKLHREVPDLNRLGIEVRYVAFPRAGIGSESYNKIASAWCAEDKQTAMTKLKNRESIPANVCPNNPVEAQYKLGSKIGVQGTPALIADDGRLMPGYMPALQLASALGVEVPAEVAAELAAKQQAPRQ